MWFSVPERRILPVLIAMLITAVTACQDVTGPAESQASISFRLLTPATVRTLIVTVSGPGMDSAVVLNLPVDENAVAEGTVSVLSGSVRRLEIVALDSGNVATHRADTTIRLIPGVNPPVSLIMRPLSGSVGIRVTFGNVTLTLASADTLLRVGDSLVLDATASAPWGVVSRDSLQWGTNAPASMTVSSGVLRCVRAGQAVISVTYGGAVVRRRFTCEDGGSADGVIGIMVIEQVASNGGSITSLNLETGAFSVLVPVASGQGDLKVDRSALVYWRPFDNRLFRANADGSGEIVIASGAIHYTPRWSFDGQRLVSTREYGGELGREIVVMNADGSSLTRLTTNSVIDEAPHLSPDGTRIAFVSERDGNPEIYVMNVDGSTPVRLTNSSTRDHQPSWSPDGLRILFLSDRSGATEVHSMAADGSDVKKLTNAGSPILQMARWSPSGLRFAFVRKVGDITGIWTAAADGSDLRLVREVPSGVTVEYPLSWR